MYKIRLVVFATLTFSLSVAGQEDYVVKQNDDTVRGRVSFQQFGKVEQVQVKGTSKETISAVQVKWAMLKGKAYKPVQYSGSVQMMEVMMDGYLSLLAFRLPNLMTYDGRLLQLRDGRMMEVPSIGFKKHVSNFLSDYPALAAQIKDGDLDRLDLDKIVTEYNAFVDKTTLNVQQQIVADSKQKTKFEVLSEIQTEIEQSEIEGKKDLLEMLNEVKDKISNNKSIPAYLSNSLKDGLKSKPSLVEKLDRFFGSL